MIEPRAFPFGGVPVYNPQSLSKGEALAQFHARQAAYQSLMDTLREENPSHVLIIGTRGMGKTTLLQRVRYGVEDDAELNGRYIALAFPEEQYNVNKLHHFLLNTVDALADAMERLNNKRMLERVEAYAEVVGKRTPEEIEEEVPKFLAEIGRQMKKSFLLLVDNADRLFETIEGQQQWRLRELLSSRRDLTFFGATTQASEGIYGPERAFYEFFKIHRLGPLTLTEVRDVLLALSESVEEKEGEKGNAKRRVAEWLDADAGRLRTLVQLTGGNPRTTVLLFHLVLDGLTGGAREYLEQLLDQVTPNYKGRVDELPPQAQQILDAVALRWDPVTAMEIGEITGLETSAVSSQLTRLFRQGILEKADPGESKKALYQVAERFFNIWYLMRASRRVKAKLRWFVEFLRVFFESGELEKMAWERIEQERGSWRKQPAQIETAFACILASGSDPKRFLDFFRQQCGEYQDLLGPYLELIDGRAAAKDPEEGKSKPSAASAEVRIADLRRAIVDHPEHASNWLCLGLYLATAPEGAAESEEALRQAIRLNPKSLAIWVVIGVLLTRSGRWRQPVEAAMQEALELEPKSAVWNSLRLFLEFQAGRRQDSSDVHHAEWEYREQDLVALRTLGASLYWDSGTPGDGVFFLEQAYHLNNENQISTAILATALRGIQAERDDVSFPVVASRDSTFWNELLGLKECSRFGKLLLDICDSVAERDPHNPYTKLYRAVALAQLSDFPRASVALDDALTGDPIELLEIGRRGIEMFFAAAVRNGRVGECLEVIDKKEWKDAWRPIYEALKAVEAGSAEYLKRVAVEIREPAVVILRRIAPKLTDLPEQQN